jgi:predicted nucleotidyltransferase
MDILHKKAHRWAKILGRCPGVRAIFLSGSVAEGRGTKESDIDFFIIAKSGQIWTARFFTFLVLKIFNQLAKPHHHAGKICPNHFIADHQLKIIEQDLYSAKLFTHNIPLYDPQAIFLTFVHENKEWVKAFGEGFDNVDYKGAINCRDAINRVSTKRTGALQCAPTKKPRSWSDKILAPLQITKIKKNPDFKKKGAVIIFTDDELRFHPEPKNRHFSKS